MGKITFVNGKSTCGCVMQFSDGYGEYSDVHTIILCKAHNQSELLEKVINTGELTRLQHEELEFEVCSAAINVSMKP